jgi:hypothetical protein
MEHYEYMRIATKDIPTVIFDQYKLTSLVHNGHVYDNIHKGM